MLLVFFSLIIVIWCHHILTFDSFKVLAVILSRAMPSAHKQMGCILHSSGSNSRCSWSRILDSDTKWKSRVPWLPLVCCCTKTYAYLYPTANWMEYPSNGIKKHPLMALLKYSPAVLKSSILSWQALRLDLSRHALLVVGVVRYTMRIKRTPTHQCKRCWCSGPRKHEQSYHWSHCRSKRV